MCPRVTGSAVHRKPFSPEQSNNVSRKLLQVLISNIYCVRPET